MLMMKYIFLFKQKTAYEMRISDWSSDVCSSDLFAAETPGAGRVAGLPRKIVGETVRQTGSARLRRQIAPAVGKQRGGILLEEVVEIGRASCRERVCQYV